MAEDKENQSHLTIEEEDEQTEASAEENDESSRQGEGLVAQFSVSSEGTSEEYKQDRASDRFSVQEGEEFKLQQLDGEQRSDSKSANQRRPCKSCDPKLPKTEKETLLLKTVKEEPYPKVRGKLTAKALMEYSDNPLIFAIKVTERLHERANKKGPDEDDFIGLANRVEEFTLRFLDPLKYEEKKRKAFLENSETDRILVTAIKHEQKKFFDHPIIIDLLTERWYGGRSDLKTSNLWWLFLSMWCLFDIVLFPVIFLSAFLLDVSERYNTRAKYARCIRQIQGFLQNPLLHLR